jgi:tRNA dimethylallyltransferase
MMQRTILIAGPTASGKSALAVAIAAGLGGIVVNADSMQVYRDLEVLTARPSAADMGRARHFLYGHIDGAEAYSVARWLAEVEGVLADARRDAVPVIVVGGTGLYFKALTEGLSPVPEIPAEVREHWRRRAASEGAAGLHSELMKRDPETAGLIRATDPQRLTRALEVLDATGVGLSVWQRRPGRPLVVADDAVKLVVSLPREDLVRRAERRFDAMIAGGALDEVRWLKSRELSPELPVMRALGVPPLLRHLRGQIDLEAAVLEAKGDTRQYIRRQATWLRRHMISWLMISAQEMERILRGDFTLIRS